MFSIGIVENVAIAGAKVSDKGGVSLSLKQLSADENMEDMFNSSDSNVGGDDTNQQLIFPPKTEIAGQLQDASKVKKAMIEYRNVFNLILEQYMPANMISWDAFLGLDPAEAAEGLTTPAYVAKMAQNYAEQFVQQFNDNADKEQGFRFFFLRNNNGYPVLRQRFVNTQPFMESMSVPLSQTKLGASDYEKQKGLDQPLPASGTNGLPV